MSTDHNFWRERIAEADSNRGPSAYQPNALPLGQTGSRLPVASVVGRFYMLLFSALEQQTHCNRMWFYMSEQLFFIARFVVVFVEYPPKWCTYSAGMAGATWNCCRLGASYVYTIQPSVRGEILPHKATSPASLPCKTILVSGPGINLFWRIVWFCSS